MVFVREVAARFLREAGYDVTAVADGSDAWRVFQDSSFDLVITDQTMPHVSGSELITRLRTANPALPIIVISGLGGESQTPSSLPSDVSVLYKPFDHDRLVALVRVLLPDHRSG